MRYLNEKTLEIRMTQDALGKYGCDIVCPHTDELIFGWDPEFDTVQEALTAAVVRPEVGLCSESTKPLSRPDLDWDFVEAHYPDYHRCDIICQSGDMAACFEFADTDPDEVITADAVGRLKALASDKQESREPSYQQVQAFDDYVGSGLTFGQAARKVDDYCLAKAVLNCPDALPTETLEWAQAVLAD